MPPLTAKNLPKIGKKREEIRKEWEKRGKIGKKTKNREGLFTLPLLTDRAGYASEYRVATGCFFFSVGHSVLSP